MNLESFCSPACERPTWRPFESHWDESDSSILILGLAMKWHVLHKSYANLSTSCQDYTEKNLEVHLFCLNGFTYKCKNSYWFFFKVMNCEKWSQILKISKLHIRGDHYVSWTCKTCQYGLFYWIHKVHERIFLLSKDILTKCYRDVILYFISRMIRQNKNLYYDINEI